MSFSTGPVSLVIPCLNAERTLAQALESAFRQTVPPMEVLLVDDGSADNSVKIARSFGPRVRVLRNPRGSTGPARRLGAQAARGEFVALLDADDIIEPTKHERQLAVLEKSDPFTLVHTASKIFFEDGSRPDWIRAGSELAVGRCTQVIFEHNPVCGASVMMRRRVILELGSYDDTLHGTDDFNLSLVASTRCEFVHLAEPLYLIRRHAGNMTNRRSAMVYMHWLAQEHFRQRCPEAFAALPPESVREFMVAPVVQAVREAYWHRDSRDYRRLLKLAIRLTPEDSEVRRFWRRRWLPMRALRAWDALTGLMARQVDGLAEA